MTRSSKTVGHHLPMEQPTLKAKPLREELRHHSRYIRDILVPLLSREPKLTHSDTMIIHSIFKKLDSTPMTLDLLRFSRIEKAMMVIANTGPSWWPVEVVEQAEEMIQRWEDQLGPLKNLRADLHGQGGRLEGLSKIIGKVERDDDAKFAWSVEGFVHPSKAHRPGHLGFKVGDWWLKPAAAYRDGMIDKSSNGITADNHRAYAIVLSGTQEQELRPDDQFKYHATPNNCVAWRLTKTMVSDTDKVVRVLRSWRLRSKLAPKAGLRYDGLYRVIGFGVKLLPPDSYYVTCTLTRIPEQPSIQKALHFPTADQLDDWKDYQHLKTIDRGDDFAFLREIVRKPTEDLSEDSSGIELGKSDSGYFSRRDSKLSEQVKATPVIEKEEEGEDTGYFSRRTSGLNKRVQSVPDIQFTLVAEGTPTSRSENSSISEVTPESGSTLKTSDNYFAPAMARPGRAADGAGDYFDQHPGHRWTYFDRAEESKESVQRTLMPRIEQSGINDSTLQASGVTVQPTNHTVEPANTDCALACTGDFCEQYPGTAWSNLQGADKDWNIVQGSPTSGRDRSSIHGSTLPESITTLPESIITVKGGSETFNTAKVEITMEEAGHCLDTHPGTRRLRLGPAAE